MSARGERFRLPKELQYAAAAAAAMVLSFLLPWYQKTEVISGRLSQVNVSALGAFTFVEAAILLVAVAVVFLVWTRSQKKGFHLPGGDGVAIILAGGWASPGGTAAPDLNALFALLESLRGTLPPELARQLADALRDLLIAIRAILDYSIDRLDTSRPEEPQVEDIPIR